MRAFGYVGRPIYDEWGGMMYLSQQLQTSDGQVFPMTGVLPLDIEMTDKLVRFGYVEVVLMRECLLGNKGTVLRGHSFHYSRSAATDELPAPFHVRYSISGENEVEGVMLSNMLARY